VLLSLLITLNLYYFFFHFCSCRYNDVGCRWC
jgi:hypothetical protein